MVRDISYCSNKECPFHECWRNLYQLRNIKQTVIISMSDFGDHCRKYLLHTGPPDLPPDIGEDCYLGDQDE